MFLKGGDSLDLTLTDKENFEEIFLKSKLNLTEVRSLNYKKRVIDEFQETFDSFLEFFSNKFSIEKDSRLQNYLKPWWLQAVFIKLDRKDFSNALIDQGIKSFECEKEIVLQPFLNHTDIKDKIGNDKNLNNLIVALILKKRGLNFSYKNSLNKKNLVYKNFTHTYLDKFKFLLQTLIINYVVIFSKIIGKKFQILTDTSNYSRHEVFIKTIKCNILPFINLRDISEKATSEFLTIDLDDCNLNELLFELFASKNLAIIFKKFQLNDQYAKSAVSHKGFLNNLLTRSFITASLNNIDNINLYPHGGLSFAIWTEEGLTAEICGAEFKNIKINTGESKYFVNTNVKNYDSDILVTLFSHTKYVSRFRSGMTHHEYMLEYLNNIESFLKNLDQQKYKVKLRMPLDNRSDNQLISKYTDLGYEIDMNKSINKSLSQSRIHVPAYNATLPIYSIINNIPSIFFWNDNHFPLPKKFDEITLELKKANLLFNNSNDFTYYLNETSVEEIINNWNINDELVKNFGSLILNN